MKKIEMRQQVIKWQLILSVVVCVFIVFCVLPCGIIAADANVETVQYVDREWNETTGQVNEITTDEEGNPITYECTVLTKKICKKGLGNKDQETWYVLNENIDYGKRGRINITGNAHLVLKDDCTFDYSWYKGFSKRGIYLNEGATLTIYGQTKGTGTIKVDGGSGKAGIRVAKGSTLNIKGGSIYAYGTQGGAGIGGDNEESSGKIEILGGTVTAEGGRCGAGIGGGKFYGDGGTTIIHGGTIIATGGVDAAGIGGGSNGDAPLGPDGGSGGNIIINGGTITATAGSSSAEAIGRGMYGRNAGTKQITGGNIKGYSNHTIILDGVNEEVSIVDINCNYGINDVMTLDKDKLYFYISDTEYKKLTEITVRDKTGKEDTYYKTEDSNVFSNIRTVYIAGVEAQNGVYNGLPQQGYTGTPTNEQDYTGEYETTYYSYNGEMTTSENSGAEGEGKTPIYAGNYKVKIAVPSSNKRYKGFCELEFKVERATPEIVEKPKLSGLYGTVVKDMKLTNGVAKIGDNKLDGIWKLADSKASIIPYVDTTDSYEVTFMPTDTRNCNSLTTMVVPKVEKATPTIVAPPTLSGAYGTAVKDMNLSVAEAQVIGIDGKILDGEWKLTDSCGCSVPKIGTIDSYEVTFTPKNYCNYNFITTMVVPEVYEVPDTMEVDSILSELSAENKRQKLIYKIKDKVSKFSEDEFKHKFLNFELISTENKKEIKNRLLDPETRKTIGDKILNFTFIVNSEIKEKFEVFLLYPEIQNKIIYKITSSEIIKNEKVKEKLLGFIEE